MYTQVPTNKISKWTNTREYIVVHHTASNLSSPDINVVNYLATNPAKVSCHYVVGRDGTIYRLATDDKITRHAGVSKRAGRSNMNMYSIWIEVISDWYNYTEAQKVATRKLIIDLMDKYNIQPPSVLRHADITTRKRDIWPNFYAPLTRPQYQQTLKKSFTDFELAKANSALHGNSELWESTSDQWLKKQLNDTNNMIRKYYWIK